MTKLKPIKQLVDDVREGDLVGITFVDEDNNKDRYFGVFRWKYKDNVNRVSVNFSSSSKPSQGLSAKLIKDNNIYKITIIGERNPESYEATNYEVLRRA